MGRGVASYQVGNEIAVRQESEGDAESGADVVVIR
jgi:hypothetical protein